MDRCFIVFVTRTSLTPGAEGLWACRWHRASASAFAYCLCLCLCSFRLPVAFCQLPLTFASTLCLWPAACAGHWCLLPSLQAADQGCCTSHACTRPNVMLTPWDLLPAMTLSQHRSRCYTYGMCTTTLTCAICCICCTAHSETKHRSLHACFQTLSGGPGLLQDAGSQSDRPTTNPGSL